jgi:hemoglobin
MENQSNLYNEIGGEEKVGQMVDDFYNRIMKDDSLNHFFKETNMEKQRKHQTNFLSYALGGPNQYSGRAMAQAHSGLNTQDTHFDSIIEHMREAMKKHQIGEDHIEQVIQNISKHRQDIVSE